MTADQVTPLLVPQVNVNDDSVLLVRWVVAQYAQVAAGETVCEVETSKATAEVTVDRAGILVQSVEAQVRVRVGDTIGAVAPTREAAEASLYRPVPARVATTNATSKARALAASRGVSLDAIARAGVRGTIKESDVRRFLDRSDASEPSLDAALPAGLEKYLDAAGPIAPFDAAVAANLRRSTSRLLLTSVDADCPLDAAHRVIAQALGQGRMASLLHLVIAAAARVLPQHPRLMSFAHAGTVYRYRSVDIAFVARTPDGRLYTPVVRAADRTSLEGITRACQAVTLRVMRGTVTAEELEGGCITISHLPVPGTTRVAALPSFGQSAIIGVAAERQSAAVVEGVLVERPIVTLTLTYDHTLCDGFYAADFLAALAGELQHSTP
jgi:pyruvate dehydrogenase E2 component (dihydrolipoamide acetyltransferase)